MDVTFKELRRQLDQVYSGERETVLQAIVKVGSFEQLSRMLDDVYSSEREMILQRISDLAAQSGKRTNAAINRNKGITSDSLRLFGQSKQYDVFIAHASEDKSFVTPLASALTQRGLKVWYDDFILKLGDSLRREIDRGLAQSRYGVVVLSHNFFLKHWPQKELDGLAATEQLGTKVILPVWHNIDKEEVAHYSPTLADIVAVKSIIGIEAVVTKIIEAISI